MIPLRQAAPDEAEGISQICAAGWRGIYASLYSPDYIEGWQGADRGGVPIGAGGGGLTSPKCWESVVLCPDPDFRRQGAGNDLVGKKTRRALWHAATEQWVPAARSGEQGLPFDEALGHVVLSRQPSTFTPTEETASSLRPTRRLSQVAGARQP
jgi:hypothetical protein